MSPQLVLHVGLPKTGSTALIDFLRKNTALLAQAGFVFPQGKRIDFFSGDHYETFVTPEWDKVKKALEEGDKRVLVCNENLCFQLFNHPERVETIRTFLGDVSIRIVIYLRRQDLFLESLYREMIRGIGSPVIPFDAKTIEAKLEPGFLDYDRVIEYYAGQFGKDNVTVRPFQSGSLLHGDLVRDFCNVIDLKWNDSFWEKGRSTNKAADARLTPIFLKANQQMLGSRVQTREFKEVIEELGRVSFSSQENNLLPLTERKELLSRYEKGNNQIAADCLGQDSPLFSTQDLPRRAEVAQLTEDDLLSMLLELNGEWANGLGAVPFPVYNKLRIAFLQRRKNTVGAGRRSIINLQIIAHSVLDFLSRLNRKWPDGDPAAKAMSAVARNMRLKRESKNR